MTNLPVLKIGCGVKFKVMGDEAVCGSRLFKLAKSADKPVYCYDCMTLRYVILKHAAAHHNMQDEGAPKDVKANKCFQCYLHDQLHSGNFCCCPACVVLSDLIAARDAVLALAGLTENDLKVK